MSRVYSALNGRANLLMSLVRTSRERERAVARVGAASAAVTWRTRVSPLEAAFGRTTRLARVRLVGRLALPTFGARLFASVRIGGGAAQLAVRPASRVAA